MSLAPVAFFQLFKYSSKEDLILLGIANLFIIYSSLNIPLVNIVYGLMMREMNDYVARKGQLTDHLNTTSSLHPTSSITTTVGYNLTTSISLVTEATGAGSASTFTGTPEESRSLFMSNSFNLCMVVIVFGATRFITLYLALLFFSRAAANQAKRVKILFFRSLLRQEVSWFDQNRTGDFAIRITSDLSKFEDGIGEKIALCLNALFAWISSLISSFYYGWELTLVCLVLVPLTLFITTVLAEFQASYSVKESSALSQAFNVCHEVISSIRTVFAFSGEEKEKQRFKKSLDNAYKCGLQRNMFGALNLGFTWMSGYLGFAICLLYSTKFYSPQHYGSYDEAHIITILWSAAGCVFLLNRMMPFIEIIQIARGSASNLFSVIERQSQMDVSSDEGLRPKFFNSHVRFENVSFAYPNHAGDLVNPSPQSTTAGSLTSSSSDNQMNDSACTSDSGLNNSSVQIKATTIKDLSLEVKSGQTIALVGPSGSGKSTVLSLLQRFYDIHEGRITLDGHELRDLNLAWLRSQFGVVTQEPVLFDMSIADNIRLGASPGQQLSDYDVEQAARAANAHAFIVRLPEGYETRAGARGVQLSGGQKQRIAIARALVRQPKILLLDEATSALDLESESIVQKALDQASVGRTTFVVAHRLSTIRNADKIFVFDRGTIVETGTHEELLQLRGLYYQISTQQRQSIDLQPGAGNGSRRHSQVTQPHLTSMDHSHHLAPYNRDSRSLSIYSTGKYAATAGALGGGAMGHGGNGEAGDNGGSCTCSPPGGERSRFTNYLYGLQNSDERDDDDDEEEDEEEEEEESEKQRVCRVTVDEATGTLPEASVSLADAPLAVKPPPGQHNIIFNEETQCSLLEGLSMVGGGGGLNGASKSKGRKMHSLSIPKILQFIKPNPAFSAIGILSSLLMGLCIPISALIIGDIATIFSTDQREHIRHGLFTHGLLYTVLAAFAFTVSLIQVMSFGLAGEKIGLRLRMRGFSAILSREISWFDLKRNNPGVICARLASDVGNVQLITGNRTAVIFQSISILVSTLIFAIYFNPKFSSICAMFVAILLISTLMQAKYAGKLALANRAFDSQMGKIVLESSANIKTLVSLHQEEHFISKCEELLAKDRRSMSLDNHLRLSLESLKYAMTAISKGSAFYFAARMLANDEIAIDVIFKLIEIILYGLTEASKSLIFISDLQKARRGTQNLYKLIMHQQQQGTTEPQQQVECVKRKLFLESDLNNDYFKRLLMRLKTTVLRLCCCYRNTSPIYEPLSSKLKGDKTSASKSNLPRSLLLSGQNGKAKSITPLEAPAPGQPANGELQFRNLRFHYPGRLEVCVLKSLSLDIKCGNSVALVGRSGCGKSTVVQLLERFYDYLQGEILLDGVELRRLPTNWVRQQLALVGQEPALLSYSIGDNIRYGDNSRQVSFDEVVRAAQVANIHEFIMSLPEQYDTMMGDSSSMQLSGGQKQRIAIARALVRRAPILILDEATSALDTKSELVVQEALERAQVGRTTLVIAHRLTSIKKADAIVVLKDGLVVEHGTHEELMEKRGEYYSLYRTQSRF